MVVELIRRICAGVRIYLTSPFETNRRSVTTCKLSANEREEPRNLLLKRYRVTGNGVCMYMYIYIELEIMRIMLVPHNFATIGQTPVFLN